MKKMIAFVLASVLILALVACGNDKGQDYLNATVLEIMKIIYMTIIKTMASIPVCL